MFQVFSRCLSRASSLWLPGFKTRAMLLSSTTMYACPFRLMPDLLLRCAAGCPLVGDTMQLHPDRASQARRRRGTAGRAVQRGRRVHHAPGPASQRAHDCALDVRPCTPCLWPPAHPTRLHAVPHNTHAVASSCALVLSNVRAVSSRLSTAASRSAVQRAEWFLLCRLVQHPAVLDVADVFVTSETDSHRRMAVLFHHRGDAHVWQALETAPCPDSRVQSPMPSTWRLHPYFEPSAACLLQQVLFGLQYAQAHGVSGASLPRSWTR